MKEEVQMPNMNMAGGGGGGGGGSSEKEEGKYFIQKETLVPRLHFNSSPTEKKRTKAERGENGEKVASLFNGRI